MRTATLTIVLMLAASALPAAAQSQEDGDREIVSLGGDAYRVRDGARHTIFLVTTEGIVVVDPLSVATAQWMNVQFTARFPGVPVKYVVLTHHHADRASGAAVFAGATQVGHENFRDAARESRRGRGAVYRYVPFSPAQIFRDRRTIDIGGKKVELVFAGPFHSPDNIVVGFPSAHVAFAVDPPPLRIPFTFGSMIPAAVVRWFEAVMRLDFDTIVFSDGSTMRRAEIAPLAEYLSRLRVAVLNAYERGRSLEHMQDALLLDSYKSLPHYAGRREHIADLYRRLAYRRADMTVTGLANYFPENPPDYCATFARCSAGGAVPAGSAGLTVAIGRRFGVQGDVTLSEQFWATRSRPPLDEEVVMRPTRVSILGRMSLARSGGIALFGGVSSNFGSVRGINRIVGQARPDGGRHPIDESETRTGFTGGIELSARVKGWRVIVPIGVTQVNGTRPEHWPGRVSAHAGAGLAIPIYRRVE